MPYELGWDQKSTVTCRFFGSVDFDDINNASNDFLNDSRSDDIRYALWDFSSISSFCISEEQASEIAATDSAASDYMKPLKAAFVTKDPALAALVREYIREMHAFGSHWINGLFGDVESARQC